MIRVTIWRGSPSSGGTGYVNEAPTSIEAFSDAGARSGGPPLQLAKFFLAALDADFPQVRIGDNEWSVEIIRG
jgi:hypothetical protein